MSTTTETTWKQKRAQIAGLSRVLPPDDPKLTEARRDLKALRLEEHVEKMVATWPPLSDEQLARIAALLRAGGGTAIGRQTAVQARLAALDGGGNDA